MMSDEEFCQRVKELCKKCTLPKDEKKDLAMWLAVCCDTEEHERILCEYLQRDDITLESAVNYINSFLPPVEIVDDDEMEEE